MKLQTTLVDHNQLVKADTFYFCLKQYNQIKEIIAHMG
jgi:hypothetical protein